MSYVDSKASKILNLQKLPEMPTVWGRFSENLKPFQPEMESSDRSDPAEEYEVVLNKESGTKSGPMNTVHLGDILGLAPRMGIDVDHKDGKTLLIECRSVLLDPKSA